MPVYKNSLKKAARIWDQARPFLALWLALIGLGGFVVLVGGPWALGLLAKIFGPAAARPGRFITLDMLFTLPVAIYFWIHERRLENETILCPQCGERYPKTNSSCPMCGAARPQDDEENSQPGDPTTSSAKDHSTNN